MKKMYVAKNKSLLYKIMPYFLLIVVCSLSIAYAAFGSEINITGTVAIVAPEQLDIRITGVSVVPEDESSESDSGDVEIGSGQCALAPDSEATGYDYGAKYNCDPGDGIIRTFYIIEDGDNTELIKGENGTAGENEVSLILNENMGETIQWGEEGDSVPTIALQYLYSQTIEVGWTVEVYMPYLGQIDIVVQYANDISFLEEGIDYEQVLGYWGLDTDGSFYAGILPYFSFAPYDEPGFGVRPVITISKDQIGGGTSDSGIQNNGGTSSYSEYTDTSISTGITLPNEDSSVTYNVEITNIGNVESGLLEITGLPDNLDYEIVSDYKLKDKICDENGACKLGIKKNIQVKIKYEENGYDSSNTYYDVTGEFNFQPIYTVTYTDIENNDYPTEVIKTDTLTVDFGDSAPSEVTAKIEETEISNYTYSSGVLTIPNVYGNVEIIGYYPPDPEVTGPLVTYLTNLYMPNRTAENNNIIYNIDTRHGLIDDGLGGTVSSGGNIRYYGATPNNYIDIGDRDADGNVILWRIIGVFKDMQVADDDGNVTRREDLVKIIRANSIGNMAWDSNDLNNWSTATLNTYLNTSTYYPSLSAEVKSKLENALWNLGGYTTPSIYSNDMYGYERGTARYDTTSPLTWPGKIGLMYPSDYGYAADLGQCEKPFNQYSETTLCTGTDWLFNSESQWTLTPNSSLSNTVFLVASTGFVYAASSRIASPGVRPVLYLKSDVTLTGTGTTSDGINYYVVD